MEIIKFIDNGHYYIYDININQVVEVEKIIYDLLPDLVDNNYAISIPFNGYDSKQLNLAIEEIKIFQKNNGLFSNSNIKGIYSLDKELKEKLNNQLYHLILNITDACNLRCKYCSYGDHYPHERNHQNKQMDWNTAKRAIDFLIEHSEESEELIVGFYGGEPLLVPELIKSCVQYAKDQAKKAIKKIRFAMTTNGTLFSTEVVEFLVKENFQLLVSLDGPKEIHDRYRLTKNGKGSYDIIMEGIKKIKLNYPQYFETHLGYSCVFSPPFDLLKVRNYFSSFEFQTKAPLRLSLANIDNTTFYDSFSSDIWNDYKIQLLKLKSILMDHLENDKYPDEFLLELFMKSIFNKWHRRFIGELEYISPNGICLPGHQRTFIGTNGSIYPCEKLGYRLPIGNIWQGFDIKLISNLINKYIELCSECLTCWLKRTCSICFVGAVSPKSGLLHDINEHQKKIACDREKKVAMDNLKLYVRAISNVPKIFEEFKKENYFEEK